jgi:hypothetical protein
MVAVRNAKVIFKEAPQGVYQADTSSDCAPLTYARKAFLSPTSTL